MNLDATRTVREFATEIPNATRTFEKLGIDYCCGGGKSLRDACAQAHLALDDVLRALQRGGSFTQADQTVSPNLAESSLASLIEHIVAKHHAYVKQEIPRIQQLLHKVVAVHGQNHAELGKIEQVFQALSSELTSHMLKEEQVLFPYIIALEEATGTSGRPPKPVFGTVSNPIHMMELEHDSTGRALTEIRTLSGGHTAPEGACFSYKTLYAAFKEFEADLHQHVHLENNILFPRAIELERHAAKGL